MIVSVKSSREEESIRENEIEVRWREYFGQLLNGNVVREVRDNDKSVSDTGNEMVGRKMMREEMINVLDKMKGRKVASLGDTVMRMLKNGSFNLVNWLLRIFSRCMETGVVLGDYKVACVVKVYKGRRDRSQCANCSNIRILSILGKIYERVWISEVVVRKKKEYVVNNHVGFRFGKGCIN